MPYKSEWVPPELFIEHKGVSIYRVYEDDDWDAGSRHYHFTTDMECGEDRHMCDHEDCPHVFDVRQLSTWDEGRKGIELDVLAVTIRKAIDKGELTKDGWVKLDT